MKDSNNNSKKIVKTLKINSIAIDNMTNIVYNKDMTNNDTNTKQNPFAKGTTMTNLTHDVRVIKHIDGAYDVFANFTTVKEAVAYMRNWNANAMDSWYIVDANGNRLRMNQQDKLEVFHSLIG